MSETQTAEDLEVDEVGEVTEAEETRESEGEALSIPLADLRPALEAVLMVADQPMDEVSLATAVGYPVGEVSTALGACVLQTLNGPAIWQRNRHDKSFRGT